jgi:hypothetical protein
MATGVQVVFDCADPARLARFWAEALGYRLQDPPEGYGSWEDWLRDQSIPEERWNDASAVVDPDGGPLEERRRRVDAEVERLLVLGATKQRAAEELGGYWVVMQDPEGNEFCVQ